MGESLSYRSPGGSRPGQPITHLCPGFFPTPTPETGKCSLPRSSQSRCLLDPMTSSTSACSLSVRQRQVCLQGRGPHLSVKRGHGRKRVREASGPTSLHTLPPDPVLGGTAMSKPRCPSRWELRFWPSKHPPITVCCLESAAGGKPPQNRVFAQRCLLHKWRLNSIFVWET